MGHLILQGDNTIYPGFSLLGENTLSLTFDQTGGFGHFLELPFLVLSGTISLSIASTGATGGVNMLKQLAEKTNDLTTLTLSGSETIALGLDTGHSNNDDGVVTDIGATAFSPIKIHSSLTLIDASATTGGLEIFAGATNTGGAGSFENGASLNPNVTVTYTGLTIKGGSGNTIIENDAKNGIANAGNGSNDQVILGGGGAKASLGTGSGDVGWVGVSFMGTNEAPGNALGDKVTFGFANAFSSAELHVGTGAEAGLTAGTTSIGLTKVVNAAAGMQIDFSAITTTSGAVQLPPVVGNPTLTALENLAVSNLGGPGVAFFDFGGSEYFIATNNNETAVSFHDAVVKLVGVHDLLGTSSSGVVTLHPLP
jgi:hypothetical protein